MGEFIFKVNELPPRFENAIMIICQGKTEFNHVCFSSGQERIPDNLFDTRFNTRGKNLFEKSGGITRLVFFIKSRKINNWEVWIRKLIIIKTFQFTVDQKKSRQPFTFFPESKSSTKKCYGWN